MECHVKKKRLALVTAYTLYAYAGTEHWTLDVATQIKDRFDTTIVNLTSPDMLRQVDADYINKKYDMTGIEILDWHCSQVNIGFKGDRYSFFFPKLAEFGAIARLVKNSDVIYSISSNPLVVLTLIALARLHGKRFVMGVHGPTFYKLFEKDASILQRLIKAPYVALLGMAKEFHVENSRDLKYLKKAFGGSSVYLIPGFEVINRKKVSSNPKEFIVSFVSRFAKIQKGLDLLSEVVDKVLNRNDRIKFRVAGKGDEEGNLIMKKISARHGRNFKLLGYLTKDDVQREYENASLFVSTSRFESFQITVVAAQGYGLPVVSFAIDGPKDILSKEFQGKLIRPFDTGKMADGIIGYYNLWDKDNAEYLKLKERIANNIRGIYDSDVVIRQISDMLYYGNGKHGA